LQVYPVTDQFQRKRKASLKLNRLTKIIFFGLIISTESIEVEE